MGCVIWYVRFAVHGLGCMVLVVWFGVCGLSVWFGLCGLGCVVWGLRFGGYG